MVATWPSFLAGQSNAGLCTPISEDGTVLGVANASTPFGPMPEALIETTGRQVASPRCRIETDPVVVELLAR